MLDIDMSLTIDGLRNQEAYTEYKAKAACRRVKWRNAGKDPHPKVSVPDC